MLITLSYVISMNLKIKIKMFLYLVSCIMQFMFLELCIYKRNKLICICKKVIMDCPAEHEVLNNTVKVQSTMEKYENLCRSEKIEATNDVHEYDNLSVSLNYDQIFDLNHGNLSYFNPSISDCDVSMYDDIDYNDKTIQEEDSEDSEKTIQDEFLMNNQLINSLNNLTELRDSLASIDSVYEKIYQTRHDEEKLIDSGISLTSGLNVDDNNKIIQQAIDNCVNSQDILERSDVVVCKTVEEDTENKEIKLAQNVTCTNIEDSLQEEVDIKNISVSTIESNNFISNNESYFEHDIDFSKCMEENTKHTLSIEEDSIEKTITEIKKMDKIIKNLLCTSDDEHYDSAEERMIEDLSKMENDQDDVMRKIIESCSHVSTDFQQRSPIREISNTDSIRSSSECIIKKFRGNELFPRRCVVSETTIAKEDILKTIEEAEKILTISPCWDMSNTNANQTIENYDKNNSLEEVNDDKKYEKVNETVSQKEIDFIETEDDKINSAKTIIENIAVPESDVVESNLQKLAEITYPNRPRSRIEIQETLEKITEEKRKIEDQKKESLEALSKKFEEIDKLIADHDYISHISDNDSCELKSPEDVTIDSDSLDECQIRVNSENFEVPLTKSEIAENLKIEELEKELAVEIEEHKKLMAEYQKIIATDLEKIQLTLESESMQAYNDADIDEETKNESKDDETLSEEFSNETSEMTNDTTVIKIEPESNSESDDFFMEELKEPEKTYIKGKIYDFDEKRHGVR